MLLKSTFRLRNIGSRKTKVKSLRKNDLNNIHVDGTAPVESNASRSFEVPSVKQKPAPTLGFDVVHHSQAGSMSEQSLDLSQVTEGKKQSRKRFKTNR
jgi:hypothetical protein